MDINENYNIVTIENAVLDKLSTLNLTQNLYAGFRPEVTATTNKSEFLVVRCSTDVSDLFAHGKIMIAVDMYAKNKSNLPDRAKLSSWRNTIATVLPFSTDKYSFSYLTETPMSSDGNGYTFQIIKLTTIIKKF